MKRYTVFFIGMTMWLLAGCFAVPSLKDPFGAYEANITMNARTAQAKETIAQYDRDARIAEAENAAAAQVNTAHAWAGMLPTVAMILAVCVVVVVFIHWQGRITLERIKRGELAHASPRQQVQIPNLENLKAIAARRNQHFTVINGVALLIDNDTGQVVKRRRLLED